MKHKVSHAVLPPRKPELTPSAGIRTLEPTRSGFQDVALEPGDVLLSLGQGNVSAAIQALDGGKYSHAAIWSGECVIESTTPRVVEHSLQTSLGAHPRRYIDVYRHRRASARAATAVERARESLGNAYGRGDLVLLALLLSTSKWVPSRPAQLSFLLQGCRLNQFVKGALHAESRLVTCAGLVARSYLAAEIPLRVRVSTVGRVDAKLLGLGALEFALDAKRSEVAQLEREWQELQRQLAVLFAGELTQCSVSAPLGTSLDVTRSAKTSAVLAVGAEWSANLVTPRQLEKSPDLRFCGRLYADGKPASRSPTW